MSEPTPVATGTIGSTPLSQLLVYALERSLTGGFVFQSASNPAQKSAFTFRKGAPIKARVAAKETALGHICARLGFVDAGDVEQVAQQPRPKLFGEHLYDLGLIEREQLNTALREQLYAQLEWLAAQAPDTQYGFYENQDFLQAYADGPIEIDPLRAIGRVSRVQPLSSRVTVRVVESFGSATVQLHPQARVGRFEFDPAESAVLDVLRAKPQTYAELVATELLEPVRLQHLVALLAITKHINVPGGFPLGVNLTQSKTPTDSRRAAPRRWPGVTPAEQEAVSTALPTDARRAEIVQKVAELETADYYQVLGVESGVETAVVQHAFLQLAKYWHPDKLPAALTDLKPEVTRIFARMTEAHQVLSNTKTRGEYDKLRADGGASDEEQRKVQEVLRAASAFQKAEVFAKREDWEQALKFAEQAYRGDPEQAEYAALYAWIAARQPDRAQNGMYDDLLEILHRAVRQQRNNIRVRLYRAFVFKLAGQYTEAMRDYRFVVDTDPTNVEAQREVRLHKMRRDSSPPPGVLKRFFKKP